MRPRKVSWVFRQLTRARHFFHSGAHRPSIPDSGEGLEPVRQLSGAQRCPACPDPGPCRSAEAREPPREKWRAVCPRGLLCWKLSHFSVLLSCGFSKKDTKVILFLIICWALGLPGEVLHLELLEE